MEWTNNAAIRLVKEYEKRPELWDSSHEMYRVPTMKHEAWEDLANKFQCECLDIKKKMNSLLSSHRRERARVRVGRPSSWFLYSHMKFLPTHVHFSDADMTINTEQTENGQEEYLEEMIDEDHTEFTISDDIHEEIIIKEEGEAAPKKSIIFKNKKTPIKSHISTHRPRLVKSMKRKTLPPVMITKRISNNDDNATNNVLKSLRKSDLLRKKDECDSFGEYIANSLRKHDERTRSMIKHAINNILFEQEMKKYSTGGIGQYEIAVVDDDENPLILGDHIEED